MEPEDFGRDRLTYVILFMCVVVYNLVLLVYAVSILGQLLASAYVHAHMDIHTCLQRHMHIHMFIQTHTTHIYAPMVLLVRDFTCLCSCGIRAS